jgi:hypothetical protein
VQVQFLLAELGRARARVAELAGAAAAAEAELQRSRHVAAQEQGRLQHLLVRGAGHLGRVGGS